MTHLPLGHHNFSDPDDNNECKILITNADQKDVNLVLSGDPSQENTRSQWVWLRFPDGALVLAVFPQGDQYFNVEPGVERSVKELTQDRSEIADATCYYCGEDIDLVAGEYFATFPGNNPDCPYSPMGHSDTCWEFEPGSNLEICTWCGAKEKHHPALRKAPWVITDTDHSVLNRFFTEWEAQEALMSGSYPDFAVVGYVHDPGPL